MRVVLVVDGVLLIINATMCLVLWHRYTIMRKALRAPPWEREQMFYRYRWLRRK